MLWADCRASKGEVEKRGQAGTTSAGIRRSGSVGLAALEEDGGSVVTPFCRRPGPGLYLFQRGWQAGGLERRRRVLEGRDGVATGSRPADFDGSWPQQFDVS